SPPSAATQALMREIDGVRAESMGVWECGCVGGGSRTGPAERAPHDRPLDSAVSPHPSLVGRPSSPIHPHTSPTRGVGTRPTHSIEVVGGAVALDSRFYVERPADAEFRAAVARRESIVLLKGAAQVGKSSLLARGLRQAGEDGARF